MNEKDIREAIQRVREALESHHRAGGVFWPMAVGASVGLGGCCLPPFCHSESIYAAPDDDDVIVTTTTHSTSTTTSSSTRTTTCDADLTQATGATPECSLCVQHSCCALAEAYVTDPSASSLNSLADCAGNSCGGECIAPLCNSDTWLMLYMGFRSTRARRCPCWWARHSASLACSAAAARR